MKWVQLPRVPMLTVYKKAAAHATRSSPKPFVTCVNCLSEWPLGMWLCLSCWEPVTFRAMHDAIDFLDSHKDREIEVRRRSGLSL